MAVNRRVYFAGDFHLGVPGLESSAQREKRVIAWLYQISEDAEKIYLLGDIFDFWFEYREVVPKGHFRLLTAIDNTVRSGIPVEIFTGNHDMWMFDYLEKELGVIIRRSPKIISVGEKAFLIGHGDGLGPGDKKYKLIKRIFANSLCQWLFARLHPNLGIRLAKMWSKSSRRENGEIPSFLGPDGEWLIQYCEDVLKKQDIDFFVFGHRHLPIHHTLSNGHSQYINVGDWISHYSYAYFDGHTMNMAYMLSEDEISKIKNV